MVGGQERKNRSSGPGGSGWVLLSDPRVNHPPLQKKRSVPSISTATPLTSVLQWIFLGWNWLQSLQIKAKRRLTGHDIAALVQRDHSSVNGQPIERECCLQSIKI